MMINVTSFSVFYTEDNSEYWSQQGTQNGNIPSIELDVYGKKQSIFISRQTLLIDWLKL